MKHSFKRKVWLKNIRLIPLKFGAKGSTQHVAGFNLQNKQWCDRDITCKEEPRGEVLIHFVYREFESFTVKQVCGRVI